MVMHRQRAAATSATLLVAWVFVSMTVLAETGEVESADNSVSVEAIAVLHSCSDPEREVGVAVLQEAESKEGVKVVSFDLAIDDPELAAGQHGVHIHETGACKPCGAAKGHFDPGPNSNSSPDGNHPFHMGDLVNIAIDEAGQGKLNVISTRITLSPGPLSIFDADGSAVIVHVNADSYCPLGEEAGCAGGARAACGVITTSDSP
ncbi:MAG: superoxide dismutase family protein [Gammaproteobacteria bacterium]|nr:superoxide dismutase family protein [Gammaproteobacteria bacterium]